MRTLEKGFGNCSLRTSTFICLTIIVIVNAFIVLGVLGGYANTGFVSGLSSIVVGVLFIAVFGYTIYKLYLEDPSMLNVAFVVLVVYIVLVILGCFATFFVRIFSISFYLFTVPYIVFTMYSAWILYSYSIEFKAPVSIHA